MVNFVTELVVVDYQSAPRGWLAEFQGDGWPLWKWLGLNLYESPEKNLDKNLVIIIF